MRGKTIMNAMKHARWDWGTARTASEAKHHSKQWDKFEVELLRRLAWWDAVCVLHPDVARDVMKEQQP